MFWRAAVIDALTLAAWTLAWGAAFGLQNAKWLKIACGLLAGVYIAARLLSTTLFFLNLSNSAHSAFATILQIDRLGFLLLLLWIVYRAVADRVPALALGLMALVLGSIGLFATELGSLGVPGIWFPFGIGVSRTQYAYAACDVALFTYLLARLWRFVPASAHGEKRPSR